MNEGDLQQHVQDMFKARWKYRSYIFFYNRIEQLYISSFTTEQTIYKQILRPVIDTVLRLNSGHTYELFDHIPTRATKLQYWAEG
jgi:hypothetical protein